MITPKDSRPFDLAAAKEGHPIITRDGRVAKFIAHVPDAIASNRLIMLIPFEKGGCTYSYHENGFWRGIANNNDCIDLFLAPLGYCEGKPVFAGDTLNHLDGTKGWTVQANYKAGDFTMFQWPKPAHVVETRMTLGQVQDEWVKTEYGLTGLVEFANAAIARSIADGDVITMSVAKELLNKMGNYYLGSNSSLDEIKDRIFKEYMEGLKK